MSQYITTKQKQVSVHEGQLMLHMLICMQRTSLNIVDLCCVMTTRHERMNEYTTTHGDALIGIDRGVI